jgi:hypothetical protein
MAWSIQSSEHETDDKHTPILVVCEAPSPDIRI